MHFFLICVSKFEIFLQISHLYFMNSWFFSISWIKTVWTQFSTILQHEPLQFYACISYRCSERFNISLFPNIQFQFNEDMKCRYRMTICYSLWILLIKANKNMCVVNVNGWRLVYRKIHFQWHLIVLHSKHNDSFYGHFTKIPFVEVQVFIIKCSDILLSSH